MTSRFHCSWSALLLIVSLNAAHADEQNRVTERGALQAQTIDIQINGKVNKPGAHPLPIESRLLEAARSAVVDVDAYLIGAAWFDTEAKTQQQKLKQGILFDLSVHSARDREQGQSERLALLSRLASEIAAMPITGRHRISLDPIRLEVERINNRPLHSGDQLHYPARPRFVQVSGAVLANCSLPFVGMQAATAYVKACALHPAADTDWLYLIQPDGKVMRHGVAGWNAESDAYLAPGARLYVPLRSERNANFSELNDELPRFLATQPIFDGLVAP